MKPFYILSHWNSTTEDAESNKLLGVYGDLEAAEEAKKRYLKLPGFCWDPKGFYIDTYHIGWESWTEGFDSLTVIHIPVVASESGETRSVGAVMYPTIPEVYEIFDVRDHEDVELLYGVGDCVITEDRPLPDGKNITVAIQKVKKPIPPSFQ